LTVLVTGGAGFIGSHVVDALLERGERVVVLDDLSSGSRENLAAALAAGAELVRGDVRDATAVQALFERHRPAAVLHLAAQIDVRKSVADPRFDLEVNVAGTINLLEAAKRGGGEVRFVLASTGGAIYGEGAAAKLPFDETASCLPEAPYGQSKFAAEGYVGLYDRAGVVSGAALRLGNVYGPRQDPHGEAGVVAIFCNALGRGEQPRVFGDGRQTRDYVYVGDVVDAFLAAHERRDVRGVFNVGTGAQTDVLELGARLADAYGRAFEPHYEPPRAGEVERVAISPKRAERELGWAPRTPIAEGLRLTAEWFRAGASGRRD
jgi:UDP-glucose 4-epimerase